MKYLRLSEMPDYNYNQLIEFLIKNEYKGIVNDLTAPFDAVYDIFDIEFVFNRLKAVRAKFEI